MRSIIISATALFAVACSPNSDTDVAGDEVAAPPPAENETEETGEETAAMPRLAVGQYCYFRDSADTTEALEIEVSGDGAVTGSNYGNIHQEDAGYFASFDIALTSGEIVEDGLITFDSVTEVDGDTQVGTMTWSITEDAASPEGFQGEPLTPASCDGLEDRVFPPM